MNNVYGQMLSEKRTRKPHRGIISTLRITLNRYKNNENKKYKQIENNKKNGNVNINNYSWVGGVCTLQILYSGCVLIF